MNNVISVFYKIKLHYNSTSNYFISNKSKLEKIPNVFCHYLFKIKETNIKHCYHLSKNILILIIRNS